jgi:hypothetical protein
MVTKILQRRQVFLETLFKYLKFMWGSKNLAESQNRKVLMKKQKKNLAAWRLCEIVKARSWKIRYLKSCGEKV